MLEMVEERLKAGDPTLTDELAAFAVFRSALAGRQMVPPFFFWYWHCGFRERWNNRAWGDPTMQRTFDEFVDEALGRRLVGRTAATRAGDAAAGAHRVRRQHPAPHPWRGRHPAGAPVAAARPHRDHRLPVLRHGHAGRHRAARPPSTTRRSAPTCPRWSWCWRRGGATPADEARAEWEIFAALCASAWSAARPRPVASPSTSRSDGMVRRYDELWSDLHLRREAHDHRAGGRRERPRRRATWAPCPRDPT